MILKSAKMVEGASTLSAVALLILGQMAVQASCAMEPSCMAPAGVALNVSLSDFATVGCC